MRRIIGSLALFALTACNDSPTEPARSPFGFYELASSASLWPVGAPAPAGCERPTDGVLNLNADGTYQVRLVAASGEVGDDGRVTADQLGGIYTLSFTSATGRAFAGEADGEIVATFDGGCFALHWRRR